MPIEWSVKIVAWRCRYSSTSRRVSFCLSASCSPPVKLGYLDGCDHGQERISLFQYNETKNGVETACLKRRHYRALHCGGLLIMNMISIYETHGCEQGFLRKWDDSNYCARSEQSYSKVAELSVIFSVGFGMPWEMWPWPTENFTLPVQWNQAGHGDSTSCKETSSGTSLRGRLLIMTMISICNPSTIVVNKASYIKGMTLTIALTLKKATVYIVAETSVIFSVSGFCWIWGTLMDIWFLSEYHQ